MCSFVERVAASENATNYSGSTNYNPQSQLPVNTIPLPGEGAASHNMWQLLEISREHWNPNALEPMTAAGVSPLLAFTERKEGFFHCVVPTETGLCTYKNIKKGRMLSHIRKDHLNFRPFACGGECGTQGCPQRFPGAAALKEHTSPRKVECHSCGKVLYAQNLSGHQTKGRNAGSSSMMIGQSRLDDSSFEKYCMNISLMILVFDYPKEAGPSPSVNFCDQNSVWVPINIGYEPQSSR